MTKRKKVKTKPSRAVGMGELVGRTLASYSGGGVFVDIAGWLQTPRGEAAINRIIDSTKPSR